MKKEKDTTIKGIVHDLQTRHFSTEKETWGEWLQKIRDPNLTMDDLVSLLHRGFDIKCDLRAEEYDRIMLYFEIAALENEQLERAARKAYAILCSKFLKDFEPHTGTPKDFKYEDARIIQMLVAFYTLKRIGNIQFSLESFDVFCKKHDAQITLEFLRKFAGCKVWFLNKKSLISEWDTFSNWERIQKMKDREVLDARADEIHFWAISTLAFLGSTETLFTHLCFQKISPAVIKQIKVLADQRQMICQLLTLAKDFQARKGL